MSKEYNISRPAAQCRKCEAKLAPAQELVATLRETDEQFIREDYCIGCWDDAAASQDKAIIGTWRTAVPEPEAKKKLFVDNDLLVNFFERLEGAAEPLKVSFRFVLALILMRKRLLVYDKLHKAPDGSETWQMHFKGSPRIHEVIDPKMDETKITETSEQLGQILEGEL